MAKEMHRADIYIGDLVQEGNMGLMLAMEVHADDTEALLSMAKESMQALLESQEETKKQDNRMVEKVNDLDEQIKKLSDELGRKVSVDELEEFATFAESPDGKAYYQAAVAAVRAGLAVGQNSADLK